MELNIVKKILPKEDILVLLKMFDRESEPSLSSHIYLEKWSIKLENAVFIHCYLNGEIIGTLAYYIGEYIFITHIAVKSEYRRLHVAQKMFDSLLLTAKNDIKLIVRKDNVAAIKFYEKNYFQLSEEDNNEYVLIRKAEPSNVHQYEVCVHCPTYNHSLYIEDCLNGFIMQKTTFPFCVVIVDDASTDGNQEIIKRYTEKYPDIIKPVLLKENHYSLGKSRKEYYEEYDNKSKYIAICEGDDYWTDPLKLQRQVDFMEANEEYSLSAENGLVQHINGNSWNFSSKPTRDITMEELLIQRQFPTASVLYRAKLLHAISRFEGPKFDTFVWTFMAQNGKIHYQDTVSSIYRRGPGITEVDKIRWAYALENFNNNMYEMLNIPSYIIKERNKDQVQCCYNGYKQAIRQKKYKIAFDLLLKCLKYDAIFFLNHYIYVDLICQYKSIKRKIKRTIKKILKYLHLWD